MKKIKVLLSSLVVFTLFIGTAAEAVYKTRIYIVNETGHTILRKDVLLESGKKVAPAFKTKPFKGSLKKLSLKGYDCKRTIIPSEWKCTAEKRVILPGSTYQKIVDDKTLSIEDGKTVKIAEIYRDQPSLRLVNWSKALPDYKNPNSDRFRPTLHSRVYPYEQIVTTLKSSAGDITLLVASERVGLSNAFGKSIAAGSIGGVSGVATAVGGSAAAVGLWLFVAEGGIASLSIGAILGTGGVTLGLGIPIAVIGGIAIAGLTGLAGLATIVGLDQKSGLVTLPVTKGDYKITESFKLRFGNIYKDVYIIISSK